MDLLSRLSETEGPAVILVDEYDKPILDNLGNPETAEVLRKSLRSFYTAIEGADEYLRFVFLTGISKFTKVGVFSAMNNLNDISLDEAYSSMLGYTREELETNFAEHVDAAAEKLAVPREELMERIRKRYDGFCFDGRPEHRVYNPFSILNFFYRGEFRNYWFESGSPGFIADYARKHRLNAEEFRGMVVEGDFASAAEIEAARPESFLFQSGYLTFRERQGDYYTLDYPNEEVLSSVASLFLNEVYEIRGENYGLKKDLLSALEAGDPEGVLEVCRRTLSAIPYQLFEESEKYYHTVFLTLFWACGVDAKGEESTSRGRSDIVISHGGRVYVLELKFVPKPSALSPSAGDPERRGGEARRRALESAAEAALEQIRSRGYADKYRSGAEGSRIARTGKAGGKTVEVGADAEGGAFSAVPAPPTLVGVAVDGETRNIGAVRIARSEPRPREPGGGGVRP
jgi:hypothetical protein